MPKFLATLWQRLVRPHAETPGSQTGAKPVRTVWIRDCTESVSNEAATGQASPRLEATVEGISQSDIYLLAGKKIEKGSVLSIELPKGEEQAVDSVLAYVLRAWPRGDSWALTCVFSSELSEDDLRSFGACRTKPLPPTRRAWARFKCDRPVEYHQLNAPDRKRQPAQTVDISATGIGLIVGKAVETGAVLSLEIMGRTGRPSRVMLACVVRSGVMTRQNQWRIGCNFIRQLDDGELEAFI